MTRGRERRSVAKRKCCSMALVKRNGDKEASDREA